MTTVICFVLLGWAAVGLSVQLYSMILAALYRKYGGRTRREVSDYPRVSILLPIKGADAEMERNLQALTKQDYPEYELLLAFSDRDDPVLPLARQVANDSKIPVHILVDDEDDRALPGGNPKLTNLAKAYRAARYPVLVHVDANVVFEPHRLRSTIALMDSGTAIVSTTVLGVRPGGLAGHVECAFLNGQQARLLLAAAALRIPFAMGKILAYRRRDLENAGGFDLLLTELADDAAVASRVRKGGGKLRFDPNLLELPVGQRSWAEVWRRQHRWLVVRRGLVPHVFVSELLFSAVVTAAVCVGAGLCWGLGAGLSFGLWAVAWYGAEAGFLLLQRWPVSLISPVAWLLRDLAFPILWGWGLASRQVHWRGQTVSSSATPESSSH